VQSLTCELFVRSVPVAFYLWALFIKMEKSFLSNKKAKGAVAREIEHATRSVSFAFYTFGNF